MLRCCLAVCMALVTPFFGGCDDDGEDAGAERDPGGDEPRAGASTPAPEEAKAADEDGDRPATAVTGPTSTTPRVPDWPSALDGLPDIDMTIRERAHMDLASRLIKKGLQAMREERFADSTERFFEAIEVDPGNITARYNLACSLSREGDRQAAVAVLGQLRDQACGSCLGKVLKAQRDTDFDPIRKTKSFQTVVGGVETQLPEIEEAADEVREWLGSKRSEGPLPIDPRRKITVKVTCSNCSDSKPDSGIVRGSKGLRTWLDRKLKTLPSAIADSTNFECKARCCNFEHPPASTASPDLLYPDELCFRIESGLVTSVSKLTLKRYAIRTAVSETALPDAGDD